MSKKHPSRSLETLLSKISAAFPGIEWQKAEYVSEGWDHEVVILDNKIVFRFPNDDEYSESLADEVSILSDLADRLEVNIPRYEYVAPDVEFAGYPIVPGRILSKEVLQSLDLADIADIQRQIAGFLTKVHRTEVGAGSAYDKVPGSYMPHEQAGIKAAAAKHLPGVLSQLDMKIVDSILQAIDKIIGQEPAETLIHGDVYSNHLLWDAVGRKVGVIDFSDMVHGDPAIDFAELHDYGEDFVNEVYAHYQGPKDEDFLKRAWAYQCWVGVYMMTDHFEHRKTSFEVARRTFDMVKSRKEHPAV